MIYESVPISIEQKAEIVHLLNNSLKIRMAVTEVL